MPTTVLLCLDIFCCSFVKLRVVDAIEYSINSPLNIANGNLSECVKKTRRSHVCVHGPLASWLLLWWLHGRHEIIYCIRVGWPTNKCFVACARTALSAVLYIIFCRKWRLFVQCVCVSDAICNVSRGLGGRTRVNRRYFNVNALQRMPADMVEHLRGTCGFSLCPSALLLSNDNQLFKPNSNIVRIIVCQRAHLNRLNDIKYPFSFRIYTVLPPCVDK